MYLLYSHVAWKRAERRYLTTPCDATLAFTWLRCLLDDGGRAECEGAWGGGGGGGRRGVGGGCGRRNWRCTLVPRHLGARNCNEEVSILGHLTVYTGFIQKGGVCTGISPHPQNLENYGVIILWYFSQFSKTRFRNAMVLNTIVG